MEIICECNDPRCREGIELSVTELVFLRGRSGRRYIVRPGHESPGDAVVGTDSHEQFVVVEETET